MDGFINFPLFLISSLLIIIAPGPDFIYVITKGISEGNKAGFLSALGVSTGLLVHTLFVAFGLSAIIQTSRIVYLIIKYVGASYLVFIGLKVLFSKKKLKNDEIKLNRSQRNVFKQGIITNVFNPKAIVTFIAFLPQFVDLEIVNPIWQFTSLGIILSLMAVVWFGIIGYFAGTFGSIIIKNQTIQNWIKYISGSIMIILGLRLVFKKD